MALSNENLELCTNARFVADCLDEFASNKRGFAHVPFSTPIRPETLARWADNEASAADMIRRLVAALNTPEPTP